MSAPRLLAELALLAVAVGGAVKSGWSAVLRYAGRWLLWAVLIEVVVIVIVMMFAKPFGHPGGFLYGAGEAMGRVHTPNTLSVLLGATATAFVPLSGNLKQDEGLISIAAVITIVIFAAWYFL